MNFDDWNDYISYEDAVGMLPVKCSPCPAVVMSTSLCVLDMWLGKYGQQPPIFVP